MDVNVTLFLQAMQFACAYYFLYNFLFAPACKILDENEQFKKKLYKNLEQEQQIKDALLQDYHIKNNAFKHILIQTIPEQATQSIYQKSMVGSTLYCVEKSQLSEQDIKKTEIYLIDHLSQVIKK